MDDIKGSTAMFRDGCKRDELQDTTFVCTQYRLMREQ